MRQSIAVICIELYLAVMLTACVFNKLPSSDLVLAEAKNLGWVEQKISPMYSGQFQLFSLRNMAPPESGVLYIYIEGDGQVMDRGYPSDDPTPQNPIALKLALSQPSGATAYLARPCQFTSASNLCSPMYWTNQRYSEQVITSMNNGVEVLKRAVRAKGLILIGYSGGGALSLLVAGRRSDVLGVVTVAGNLDVEAWTTYHRFKPLEGSINPADHLEGFQAIPQIHFVGGRDEVVPPILTEAFATRYPSTMRPKVISIKDNSHACCWVTQWPSLWNQIPEYK